MAKQNNNNNNKDSDKKTVNPSKKTFKRANEDKFQRGEGKISNSAINKSRDKKLKAKLNKVNDNYAEFVNHAAAANEYLLQEQQGFIEAESELEKTFKLTQEEIYKSVDKTTQLKAIDLKLTEHGPYSVNFNTNGTHMLLVGEKGGHIASLDWRKGELRCELNVNETVNCGTYLQNEQYFAVAQRQRVYIYDHEGVELHRMKQHVDVQNMNFMPYHYLLATSGNTGFLKYQDCSTGTMVAELRTKMGPTKCQAYNPYNAVMQLGHSNGQVTMWSPNMSTPLVKLLSGRAAINDIAIDRSGRYMATASLDKTLKIWDIRMFRELHTLENLPSPGTNLEISDTGLLAMSRGPHVTIWKDCFKSNKMARPVFSSGAQHNQHRNTPYMTHMFPGNKVENMKFVPFEDLLSVGHMNGVKNLIIPGAGEANYDALEANPFETAKQRQEQEVRGLLYKLPADSISLDPNVIGTVNKSSGNSRLATKDLTMMGLNSNEDKREKELPEIRADVKAKNSGLRGFLRKKTKNIIDDRKVKVEKALEREKWERKRKQRIQSGEITEDHKDEVDTALSRFG
ncbi:Small subunit (SSU) processome component [Hanseniaspora valbyensis]